MDDFLSKTRPNFFEYEFYLSKSQVQFHEWLETIKLLETNRAQYIKSQCQKLSHPQQKYRLLSNMRASTLICLIRDHLKALKQRYRSYLLGDNTQDIKQLEYQVKICIEAHKILYDVEYFTNSLDQIKQLFDDLLLYLHNPFIFADLAFLLQGIPGSSSLEIKKSMNLAKYDPCTPEYFAKELKELCQKYPSYFQQKCFEVSNINPKLYEFIFGIQIDPTDSKRALMIIIAKIFDQKMKDPLVRIDLLTFKSIKLNFLSDVIPLLKQGEQYENLIIKLLPQLSKNQLAMEVFLDMEPGMFLQVNQYKKRKGKGQFQKWITGQIDCIIKFVNQKQIDENLNPFLLTKKNLFEFLKLVNEIILYIEFIFQSNTETQVYNCYTKMLQFQKLAYLSFNTMRWFVPLNALLKMDSTLFEDLHIDINKQMISGVTEMIQCLIKDELPVWIEYKDGKIIQTPISRLQYVSAIIQYLKECHQQQNNFFQFPQPIPVDFASSILLVELVKIRFHQFQPNQKQIEYYTTMFQLCMKYNVYQSFNWFKLTSQQNIQEEKGEYRQIQWQMIKQIPDQKIKKTFQKIINKRQANYIDRCLNNNVNIIKLLEQLKYNIGLDISNTSMVVHNPNNQTAIMILGLMSSYLYDAEFDFKSNKQQIILNKVHLCVQVCSFQRHSKFSQHQKLLAQKIVLPVIKSNFETFQKIYRTYKYFFRPTLLGQYLTQIMNILYQQVMDKQFEKHQKQLFEKTIIITNILMDDNSQWTERQKEEYGDLAGLILSVFSQQLPPNKLCILGLIVDNLMQQDQAYVLILSNQKMVENWFNFIIEIHQKTHSKKITIKQARQPMEAYREIALRYPIDKAHQIKMSMSALQKYFQMSNLNNKQQFNRLCEQSPITVPQKLEDLMLGNLFLLLAIELRKNRGKSIAQIIYQISKRKQIPSKKIKLQDLSNHKLKNKQQPLNIIAATIKKIYIKGEQSYDIINQFIDVLYNNLEQKSYFMFVKQIGISSFVPSNFPIQTILRVGSDNKILFSFFIESIVEVVKRQNIIQQTIDALRKLKKQNYKLNVGALFCLAMVVTNCRNRQIESYLIQKLSSNHIFKVKTFSPNAESIVANTLKLFTFIIMQRAKILMKRLPDNLFKMTIQQKQQKTETIDQLFGIVYCLPSQCLTNIKLMPRQSKQIEEQQEWESQKQSDQQDSPEKKKDRNSKSGDGFDLDQLNEELQQSENSNTDYGNEDQDSYASNDQVDYMQSGISDILLNKKNGYMEYNKYILIRQQLDIAIKGDYLSLQHKARNFKNQIDDEIKKYLQGIIASLNLLQGAQNRIISKMNPDLFKTLTYFGLPKQRQPNEDDNLKPNMQELKYHMFSDSEHSNNHSDDSDESEDENDQDDYDEEMDNSISRQDSQHNNNEAEQTEAFTIMLDHNGTFNIYVPVNHGQQINQQQDSIFQLLQQQFGNANTQQHPLMKKKSSVQPYKLQTFKHQTFNSLEIDKITQILIFKMFQFTAEIFMNNYVSFYKRFAEFSAGSSSFVNSVMLLLRIPEQKNSQISQLFPVINQVSRSPEQIYSNYELFCRNAMILFSKISWNNSKIRYKEGQPGIQVIELIADQYKLPKQPHLISLLMFYYRNNESTEDQLIDNTKTVLNTMYGQKHQSYKNIKQKHISDLVKSSYENYCVLMTASSIEQMMSRRVQHFINSYVHQVTPLLLKDVTFYHDKLVLIQKEYLLNKKDKQSKIILMIEITESLRQKLNCYYYSLKSLVQIIAKTQKRKHENLKDQILQQMFTNKELILTLTTIMHHINFINKYLNKGGQKLSDSLERLMMNQIKCPNLIVMLHSAASKQLNLSEHHLVQNYLNNFMFTPGAYKFKSITEVANLIFPLLHIDLFTISKYQKVILPQVFKNPKIGYFLPLAFRLVTVRDNSKGSQTLHINRQCSFDIAFHQLRQSKFQIQYDQEEGNDQGGLKRQFMRGWTGKGVNEQFFFIGRILGIAYRDENLYGGTLDLAMTAALTNYQPDLKLLEDIDPVVYKNLLWLKQNSVKGLDLTFTRNKNYFGVEITQNLYKNSGDVQVTDQNKDKYISLYISSILFSGRQFQMSQLKRGFYTVVPQKFVSILTPQQLLIKIAGIDTIDIGQLRKNVIYEGYSEFSEVIKWFWKVVESFTKQQKHTFLHFLTGTHKIPLGLKNYNLTIERVHDITRLPVAHTCFNTLDLPEYTTQSVFVQKLKTAIFQGHDTYSIM